MDEVTTAGDLKLLFGLFSGGSPLTETISDNFRAVVNRGSKLAPVGVDANLGEVCVMFNLLLLEILGDLLLDFSLIDLLLLLSTSISLHIALTSAKVFSPKSDISFSS